MGEFIWNNIALVALVLASLTMLVWPELSRLIGVSGAEIGTLEATRLMNQGPTLILDVRDQKDFATGHLPKARHIPVRELAKRIEEIAKFKAKPVIVTDTRGARAGAACRFLKREGFTNVFQLRGGLAAWQQASLPVER